jgi:hypothetical protein
MRVVGLHLTKCAGSSIVSSIKRNLNANEFYLCSSIIENIKIGQEEFSERFDLFDLQFMFGHYIHESLHSIFRERDVTWLTVMRDPVKRVKSEWDQIYNIRKANGLEPLSVDEFIANYQNTFCQELLRAFPSMDGGRDQLEDALSVLNLFDYVFDSQQTEAVIEAIHDTLGVLKEDRRYVQDNVTQEKEHLSGTHYEDETQKMLERMLTLNSNDRELYRISQPLFSTPPAGLICGKFEEREKFLKTVDYQSALESFNKHLLRFYKSEVDLAGAHKLLSDSFAKRQAWINQFQAEF